MDDTNNQNFSLPPVPAETDVAGSIGPMPQVTQNQSVALQPQAPQAAILPAQPQVSARPSMQQAIAASLPISAKDQDLIERIWVDKAKMIVRQTYGDPFVQNKALGQVKADYIRKRYGKEIKVSE